MYCTLKGYVYSRSHLNSTVLWFSLLTADDQLEDGTKESSEDSKREVGPASTHDGGTDSVAESTEEGGVEKQTPTEVGGESSMESSSQSGTVPKDEANEVPSENTPVIVDGVKDSENPSGTCLIMIAIITTQWCMIIIIIIISKTANLKNLKVNYFNLLFCLLKMES